MAQAEGEGAGAPVPPVQGEREDEFHERATISIGHPRTSEEVAHSSGRGGPPGLQWRCSPRHSI